MNEIEKATHYTVLSKCDNCGWIGETVIPRGTKFSNFALAESCPSCGCLNTLVRRDLFEP